jgi:hypothetical protein
MARVKPNLTTWRTRKREQMIELWFRLAMRETQCLVREWECNKVEDDLAGNEYNIIFKNLDGLGEWLITWFDDDMTGEYDWLGGVPDVKSDDHVKQLKEEENLCKETIKIFETHFKMSRDMLE